MNILKKKNGKNKCKKYWHCTDATAFTKCDRQCKVENCATHTNFSSQETICGELPHTWAIGGVLARPLVGDTVSHCFAMYLTTPLTNLFP